MFSQSAGVVAGIISGLFYVLAFWILGLPFNLALFYAVLGGFTTGWIIAGWTSPDASTPENKSIDPPELSQNNAQSMSPRQLFKLWQRERYQRTPSFFVWKNPRSNRQMRRLEKLEAERKKKQS